MVVLEHLDRKQWAIFSERAHALSFDEHKPESWDRIDFSLMAFRDGKPMAYVTCREHDAKTVYWQFGGAFPETKGTLGTFLAYEAFVSDARARYDRVTTLIENTNTAMLKMAMKVGFRIIGVRCFNGSILVEHLLEFT